MNGMLYIVATPIGNLDDLAPRARETLASVDLIAAEDTRRTGRLLSHFGVKTPQIALHDHNESEVVATLIAEIIGGKIVALVSDAGMPLVNDPGYRLVKSAHESGIRVSPVPGASAVTAALAASGLPTDRYTFEGFLPSKAAARRAALERLSTEARTMVFFESVHRIADSLADIEQAFGAERTAFVGRELTKLHEQCVRATLGELRDMLQREAIVARGEFVIVVGGATEKQVSAIDVDNLIRELAAVLPGRQVAAIAATVTGQNRNAVYARMLKLTGKA